LLDYTDIIYANCSKFDTDKLKHVQYRACVIATGAIRLTKHETLLQEVGLETLKSSDLFKAFLKQVTEIADDTTNGRLFQSRFVAGKNEL
jgi:hypothetical protein